MNPYYKAHCSGFRPVGFICRCREKGWRRGGGVWEVGARGAGGVWGGLKYTKLEFSGMRKGEIGQGFQGREVKDEGLLMLSYPLGGGWEGMESGI